jgi:hypothetical protein
MQAVVRFLARWSPALANRALSIGQRAYKCGDYAAALIEFQALANQGNAIAQFFVGSMYRNGEGLVADPGEAARWIRLAAERGMVDAQFALGVMYDDGEGVKRDTAEAVRWYRLAARRGCASAQFNLGECFHQGRGVERSETRAWWWISLAAAQGDPNAQLNLGTRYLDGIGVARNELEAHLWFNLAVAHGSADATGYRDSAARDLTPNQIAGVQCRVREWTPKTRSESALDVYKGEVAEFFQTLSEGPAKVPIDEMLGFLQRADELIAAGLVLGVAAQDLVEALREVRRALAGDMERTAESEMRALPAQDSSRLR